MLMDMQMHACRLRKMNFAMLFLMHSGKMLEYRHLIQKYPEIWSTSIANEFGRLMNGVGKRMPNSS